ncbi:PLP-dependent transferase, partial [Streptomyces sp. NPDC005900]|uniref:PLP-dependent transferase n=1 Tax=Streptomyces sp. NPDC005900 TaxID=3154569 RepID=UPI0033F992B9
LAGDPRVARVHYPRLGGAMVAFEVCGDPHEVIAGVRLITPAVSLGSVDSLIQHPASISHRVVDAADRHSSGVSDRLLRMSCGLEDVEDLWRDLDQALGPVSAPPAEAARRDRRATQPPRAGEPRRAAAAR